ncbi:MAG: trypsin-like peptidase domain-containing protein [Patescibacteria group bacterium]
MASVPKIIKKISPAVASIILIKPTKEIGDLADKTTEQELTELETGSGFFINNSGLVATNRHVVFETAGDYWLNWNGKKYYAEVISRDPINDIALLQIKTKEKTPFIKLGNSAKLELGEAVIAIGNVLGGLHKTVSTGIVSGLSRNILATDEAYHQTFELRGLIQTDAAINPGNSGGPLINLSGKAIGINTAMINSYENIGFAIPIDLIKQDLADIKKFGKIKRFYLGIRYITLNKDLKQKYNLPVDYGAYILREPEPDGQGVIPHSPADRAGLKEGDIILEADNEKITQKNSLKQILRKKNQGKPISFKILRNKNEITAQTALEDQT